MALADWPRKETETSFSALSFAASQKALKLESWPGQVGDQAWLELAVLSRLRPSKGKRLVRRYLGEGLLGTTAFALHFFRDSLVVCFLVQRAELSGWVLAYRVEGTGEEARLLRAEKRICSVQQVEGSSRGYPVHSRG